MWAHCTAGLHAEPRRVIADPPLASAPEAALLPSSACLSSPSSPCTQHLCKHEKLSPQTVAPATSYLQRSSSMYVHDLAVCHNKMHTRAVWQCNGHGAGIQVQGATTVHCTSTQSSARLDMAYNAARPPDVRIQVRDRLQPVTRIPHQVAHHSVGCKERAVV